MGLRDITYEKLRDEMIEYYHTFLERKAYEMLFSSKYSVMLSIAFKENESYDSSDFTVFIDVMLLDRGISISYPLRKDWDVLTTARFAAIVNFWKDQGNIPDLDLKRMLGDADIEGESIIIGSVRPLSEYFRT